MSGTGSASPTGCGGSNEERRSLAVRGGGRRGHAAERGPGDRVLTLALDVDVAGLVPGQDGVGLVVEDVVAAVGTDHQHRVPFVELVDDDGHAHRALRQAALAQQLALEELVVLAVAVAVVREVPAVDDT